jgi:hypothetical protein
LRLKKPKLLCALCASFVLLVVKKNEASLSP